MVSGKKKTRMYRPVRHPDLALQELLRINRGLRHGGDWDEAKHQIRNIAWNPPRRSLRGWLQFKARSIMDLFRKEKESVESDTLYENKKEFLEKSAELLLEISRKHRGMLDRVSESLEKPQKKGTPLTPDISWKNTCRVQYIVEQASLLFTFVDETGSGKHAERLADFLELAKSTFSDGFYAGELQGLDVLGKKLLGLQKDILASSRFSSWQETEVELSKFNLNMMIMRCEDEVSAAVHFPAQRAVHATP